MSFEYMMILFWVTGVGRAMLGCFLPRGETSGGVVEDAHVLGDEIYVHVPAFVGAFR